MCFSSRSLRGDPYLERIVDAVKTLEGAIVMDTGMDGEWVGLSCINVVSANMGGKLHIYIQLLKTT